MSRVVLVATRPAPAALADAVRGMRAAGHRVDLIAGPAVGAPLVEAAASVVAIHRPLGPRASTRRPGLARWSPRWVVGAAAVVTRAAATKATNRTVGPGAMWAAAVRRSRAARALLAGGDVLVAVDIDAVYAVWLAAQRNSAAAAVNGVAPALDVLGLDAD